MFLIAVYGPLDELAALQEEAATVTSTGRRTRGIRIDYNKVEGGFDSDLLDYEEEDEAPKPKKSKEAAPISKGKGKAAAKPESSSKKPQSKSTGCMA